MIKTLYLYFLNSKPILFLRWLLDKSELRSVTFEAYIEKLKKDAKWIRFKPTFHQIPSRRKAICEYKIIGKKVIVRIRGI